MLDGSAVVSRKKEQQSQHNLGTPASGISARGSGNGPLGRLVRDGRALALSDHGLPSHSRVAKVTPAKTKPVPSLLASISKRDLCGMLFFL